VNSSVSPRETIISFERALYYKILILLKKSRKIVSFVSFFSSFGEKYDKGTGDWDSNRK
jgi:hypothetical protein